MLAEFTGESTTLHDQMYEPYELLSGSICHIEVTGYARHKGDWWIWTAIETQDGHVLACPYSSLEGIYQNWRRIAAD